MRTTTKHRLVHVFGGLPNARHQQLQLRFSESTDGKLFEQKKKRKYEKNGKCSTCD